MAELSVANLSCPAVVGILADDDAGDSFVIPLRRPLHPATVGAVAALLAAAVVAFVGLVAGAAPARAQAAGPAITQPPLLP